MEKAIYLINDIIKSSTNITEFKEKLLKNGIKSKEFIEEDLIIIYHQYNISIKSELQRECRSLVLKMSTFDILSYSCESPIINSDGFNYIKSNNNISIIKKCYEGSCISLFYHNNKWYLSTRKNINIQNICSKYNTLYQLFEDVLKSSGYNSFDDFTNKLNKDKSYYLVLIHYNNKHIIDYSNIFNNKEYKKLVLISVKDKYMNEIIDIDNEYYNFLNNNIFLPELDTIDNFFYTDYNTLYNLKPECEGIIIHKWDDKMNKYKLIKLQYNNYIYHSLLPNYNHISLYLYQLDKLNIYNIKNLKISDISTIFKLCTSELLELFNLMWDINSGNKLENNIYKLLPKEYKYIMFKLRGILYTNKILKINNIYLLLKSIPITYLISLLKSRQSINNIIEFNYKFHTTLQIDVYKNFINKFN